MMIQSDFHIFQRGRYTTNQMETSWESAIFWLGGSDFFSTSFLITPFMALGQLGREHDD